MIREFGKRVWEERLAEIDRVAKEKKANLRWPKHDEEG